MNKRTRIITTIAITISLLISGCEKNIPLEEQYKFPHSQITVMESNVSSEKILNINNSKISSVGKLNNVLSIAYNYDKNIYVYLLKISQGTNLSKDKLLIQSGNQEREVTDFYSALDTKLSPEAGKVAFRSFSKDDYASAQGIRVYDIKKNKFLDLKSKILVSGSLYEWLNENEIVYYGVKPEDNGNGKIYKYNFISNTESVYYDDINGYCVSFALNRDKGMLLLEVDLQENRLCYYDQKSKSKVTISKDITDIYSKLLNKKQNEFYIIGNDRLEGIALLYRVSLNNMNMERVNYDFPTQVDKYGGLAQDNNGTVYFSGITNPENKVDTIFAYNSIDRSISKFSETTGSYYIMGSD